ncbi:MAG: AAA family ATPase [Andreesenia angusta]|nr:AAA family ATPase [Andreesenia angusta]
MNRNIKDEKVIKAIDKLEAISKELNDIFVERDDAIKNSIKALVTGQTVLLIGPPGTAKSALATELCRRIDHGRYFSWLLNRTSDPAEILGPFSIKEMENDKFIRVTKNKLPEAEIVFLDEVFKCNEPTLNILLPIINEKVFYNDGNPIPVPLITMFAASNEFPEEESLMALYDRMIYRMYVDYIGDVENKMLMLKRSLKRGKNQSQTMISLDEINYLREALDEIEVSEDILKEYIYLMNALLQEGVIVSDRRQNEALKVLKANALLNKREKVITEDFNSLRDVLWNDLSDMEIIDEVLKERLLSPFEKEYNTLRERYDNILISTKNIKDTRMLVEIKGSTELLDDKINRILKDREIMDQRNINKFTALSKEIGNFMENLQSQIGDEEDMFF